MGIVSRGAVLVSAHRRRRTAVSQPEAGEASLGTCTATGPREHLGGMEGVLSALRPQHPYDAEESGGAA